SGVAGIQTSVLAGDPTKPGPYTIRLSAPANTRIAAHSHRDERTAVVISGAWYFGYGDTADEAKVKALPPGSFYTEPAGDHHFALTRDEPVVVYIFGYGPTDTVYVDPAAAPKPKP
ncbi:MAG TPA: cupin domain-containing protein, partial [Caulobacter sp.]|nr:cupin domain-containing protein [Caulobacter sp.]